MKNNFNIQSKYFIQVVAVFLTLLVSSTSLTLSAQDKIYQGNRIWLNYVNQMRFSKKWGVAVDLNYRTKDNFSDNISQLLYRPSIVYHLNDQTKLMLGYAFVETAVLNSGDYLFRKENRPWQQIQHQFSIKEHSFLNRLRLEQRFQSRLVKDGLIIRSDEFNWRLRYLFYYEVPIDVVSQKSSKFYAVINNEIMFNAGKIIHKNVFDQNRFFIGVNYKINPHNNIQLGYLNLFQQLSSGGDYYNIQIIRLNYIQNFDLRKKL